MSAFTRLLTSFLGEPTTPAATPTAAPKLGMERLEAREVPAVHSAALSGTTLVIQADNTVTNVEVNKVGSNVVVTDNAPAGNGFYLTAPTWRFAASKVSAVKFVGGDKADTFVNNDSVPTEAWGNGGNDYLEGANANDTLLGGDGNDVLKGFGGDDRLYGGNDVDELYGGSGNDALYGGGTNSADKLWGGTGKDRFLTQSTDIIEDGNGLNSLAGEDVQLRFVDSPSSSWTNTEVRVLDDAFQRLFDAVGNNRLLRDSRSTDPLTITKEVIPPDNGDQVLAYNTDPYQKNEVWYTGPWWNQTRHEDRRTVSRKIAVNEWDETSADTNELVRSTLVHEFGHTWDNESAGWNSWLSLSGWRNTPPPTSQAANYLKSEDGEWWYLKSAKNTFALNYGRTNPNEDFATAWESYFIQRFGIRDVQGVKPLTAAKYNHIDALFRSLS